MKDYDLELPKGWAWVDLKQISKILSGFAFKSTDFILEGTPIIKISNIGYSEFLWKEQQFVPDNFKIDHKNFLINSGDLLIALTRPITNNTTKVCKYPANTEAGLLNQRVASIKDINGNKEYLFWYFQTDKFKNYLKSKFSETLQPNLSPKDLALTPIPLPPLSEQQEIVAKIEELLSELDQGKQQLETARQQLKVYRQAVLKWAFEGKLTNAIQNGQKTQDGKLPEGWTWVKLGEIAKKKSAKAVPSENSDLKFIGMDCIKPNTLKPFFLYDFKEFKSSGNLFKKNQVLYGRMRPYLNKVYKAEFDGACSGEFIILECVENFSPDLLKYILHASEFVNFTNSITSGDRPRISYEEFSDYSVALAPLEEQKQIVQEIESRLSVCDKVEETITQSLQQAETLRQSILKQAFEGKL
jgi:type I restriction enzyme S subunit